MGLWPKQEFPVAKADSQPAELLSTPQRPLERDAVVTIFIPVHLEPAHAQQFTKALLGEPRLVSAFREVNCINYVLPAMFHVFFGHVVTSNQSYCNKICNICQHHVASNATYISGVVTHSSPRSEERRVGRAIII